MTHVASRIRPRPSFEIQRANLWRSDDALAVELADEIFAAKGRNAKVRIASGAMKLTLKLEAETRSLSRRGNQLWAWTPRERQRIANDLYAVASPLNKFKNRIVFLCGYKLEEIALRTNPTHHQDIIRISHSMPDEWIICLIDYMRKAKTRLSDVDLKLLTRHICACSSLCDAVKAYSTAIED